MIAAAPAAAVVRIAPEAAAARAALRGRMLLFVKPATGKTPKNLDPGFVAKGFVLEGFEVDEPAGAAVTVPASADAFPKRIAALPPGEYDMQALLDVRREYSYDGIEDGDLTGPVERVRVTRGAIITLPLDHVASVPPPASTADVKIFTMKSALLSAFYRKPTYLHASVVLPIGYDAHKRYPVVYWMNGFGGTYASADRFAKLRPMMAKDGLHAILVVTDSHHGTGITQFADSANNGPWGQAFTREFIPAIERAFPIDGRPTRRFLWGHSSGGWAALWLQVTYPNLFGGEWSGSPDPVDFHDFTGPNLLKNPPDNTYVDPYGRPWPLVRIGTKNVMNLRDFVQSSDVMGYNESQFGSFDWVFSPRGNDGEPMRLFNHTTGVVNPTVAAYWEAHYDIASKIARNYRSLAPELQHKLHIIVGTLDTFHLERGVLRLDARLRQLGMVPNITYVPNASHTSFYSKAAHDEGFHWAFRGMAAQLRTYH